MTREIYLSFWISRLRRMTCRLPKEHYISWTCLILKSLIIRVQTKRWNHAFSLNSIRTLNSFLTKVLLIYEHFVWKKKINLIQLGFKNTLRTQFLICKKNIEYICRVKMNISFKKNFMISFFICNFHNKAWFNIITLKCILV